MGKVKRTLSVILAVAMVVTMVPQTGMAVYAQEENPAIETEEPEVDVLTPEETTEVSTEAPDDADEAPAEDAQTEDAEDGSVNEDGGAEDVEAPAEETPEAEEPADEETPEVTEGDKSVTDNEVMEAGAEHTVTVTGGNPGTGYTVNLPEANEGKATEGTDYVFTITVTEGYRIKSVKYTVTAEQNGKTDEPLEENGGKYTIPGADIIGDVAITVEAEEIPTRTVTFTDKENVAKVTAIKVDGQEYATKPEYDAETDTTGAWTVTAKEGQKVSFKVVAKEFYKVTKVKDGEENPLDVDKDGVYSLTIGESNVNLTVGTELDETQAYTFVFKVKGNKGSANATVAWADGVDYGSDDVPEPDENGKLVTRNSKVKVTITADPKYDLGEVTVNGEKRNPSESNEYEVALEKGKTVTLEVATSPKERGSEATVAFTNEASHVDLKEVKVDGTAAKADEETGKYAVKGTARELEFTLVATGPYLPSVEGSKAEVELRDEKLDPKTNKTTYTYYVLAGDLDTEETFTITEEKDMKTITIDKQGDVNVVMSINGRVTSDPSVLRGTAVTFQITAADNSNLTSVDVDGKAQKISNKKTSEFTVTVNANTKITVTAEGLYKASALKDESGNDLTPVKNVYNVSYDGKYMADVLKGSEAAVLSDVKVLDSTKKEIEGVGKVDDDTTTAVIDLKEAEASKVAGQKLTVELYVAGNDKAVATYTLSVSKVVSTITLQATATQTADTVKSYKITTNGEVDKLKDNITVTNPEGDKTVVAKAEIVNGALEITTGQSLGKATVKVAAGSSEDAVSATIEITTKELISAATAKPTVSLKAASDISLTLTLGSKNIETPAAGEVYYEVKVAPKAGTESNARPEGLKETVDTVYVKRTGASDEARVVVGAEDKLGTGAAWSYDVTVALVHVKTKDTVTNIDEQIVKYDEAESKGTAFSGTFSTQNPTWEAALKLKKGKTTVYTGQKNVVIATPQFSKITTYTELTNDNVEDRSYTGDNALKLSVDSNGDIVAEASKTTAVGKHTVQVTAATDEEGKVYASRATIVINVVRGIEGLEVSVPSYSIYKAPKKAATLKATVVYNPGTTAPKTKKVTWAVVGTNHESSVADMVSIDKNGKVTVNKNYTLKADDKDNQFVIKVTANDFEGNPTDPSYSNPITVTNEGLKVNTVAIVQRTVSTSSGVQEEEEDNATVTYKVVAKPDGKNPVNIQATDANGALLVVFTGAVEKDEYDKEEFEAATVPVSNLSLQSSSAKNVAVDATSGLITVKKPANKVKLKATANDGSKAKAELLVNVTYDKTQDADSKQKDLAMKLSLGNGGSIESADLYDPAKPDGKNPVDTAVEFNGSASSILSVQVMTKESDEESTYKDAPAFTNYKLNVTGGKIVSQSGSKAIVAVDKRDVTITVTDNGSPDKTKPKVTYKLTNIGIPETTGYKPSVKVANKLHKIAKTEEQTVTINLDKVPAAEDGKNLAAKVEVNFNAMKSANTDQLNKLLEFASKMEKNVYEVEGYNNKKGYFTITFKSDGGDTVAFDLNSYPLKVTVGTMEDKDAGTFKAVSQTVATTVSVDKVKTFTYKPTTSYKIATRDGGVLLTGKANIPVSDYTVGGYELLNVNNKGVVNNFTKYFTLGGDENNILMLKPGVTPSEIGKTDLTGYLEYTANTDKLYYSKGSGTGKNTVKIKVTINDKKAAAKYAVDGKPEIDAKKDSVTEIDVTVNGAITKMAYAIVDGTPDWEAEAIADTGKVKLTTKKEDGLKVGNTYSVKLLVVSNDSFYKSKVKDAKDQEGTDEGKAYKDAMKDYGVKLTVSVKVKKSDLEIAKERLEEWLADASKEKPTWLKNDLTTADKLIAVIEDTDKGAGLDAEKVTVEIAKKGEQQGENDYTFAKATIEAPGSIKGNLTVTVNGESETVAIDLVIPAKAITKDEAVTAISDANLQEQFVLKNEDLSTNKDDKQKEIVAAAQEVIGDYYYTVTPDATGLDGTEASESDGSASITLEIKEKGNPDDTAKEVTISGFVVKKDATE